MRRAFALIPLAAMLLTLTACGKTAPNSASQNTPNEPSDTPQIETTPDAGSTTNNDSSSATGDVSPEPSENEGKESDAMTNITIAVGDTDFSAKLYDNDTARALLALFPITLNMSDLNINEKYYYFADNLPSESTQKPETINAGDIMC